ncbi:hypothetical protein SS50377_25364 [Spironucleus salmonicida]|nr:hypothetical protein SS50377_25364 [Spironucleus salmonicida]
MNADLLQNAHLFRMAQISAGMPRFELVNSEIANPNPFVFEALQQFLGLFTMLKNNDFCGDDAQVSYQEGGEQQELIQTSFRVENDCILQVKATYLNYRQFVGFLVLANPHFYDQICAICSVVEESVTKMSAHVAFLKANGVGFFAKISFFDEFQAILDSVVDGRDERAAMVTGWLLLCKKNGQ